jgi:hypothetical protein
MAERALRDTEKAERMAREAGWQPGQYWSLEVDAEAKQKLLEAEEAKRQREEAERAKEAAEKEAFMQRQMELLKKAGRAPRCEYVYTDGRGCRAPQVKGERWCHGHAKMMSYRPEKLELEPMEDEQAVMVNLYRVTKSLLAGRISEKTAGLMLWSVAIGAPGARSLPQRTQRKQREQRNGKKRSPQMNADERRSENKLGRESTRKHKTNHGGAETRRKTKKKNLPQMNADDTDQGRAGGPALTRTGDEDVASRPAQEAQQCGVVNPADSAEGHGSTGRSACATQTIGDPGHPPHRANGGRIGHPGVAHDNSFNSGVEAGVPPSSSGDPAIG